MVPALVIFIRILEVVGPDEVTIYRGNQFEAGESAPDAPAADQAPTTSNAFTFPTQRQAVMLLESWGERHRQ